MASAAPHFKLAAPAIRGHKRTLPREQSMPEAAPIKDSVGAALRFVREQWRFVITLAAAGAIASASMTALSLVPALSMFASLGAGLVQAGVYAAFIGAVLFGPATLRNRWLADGGRVWAAMVIVGFILSISFFVLGVAVMILLAAGPLAAYRPALEQAGQDANAVMAVFTRFAQENPGLMLALALGFATVWLLLTSRLYFAAPATVEQGRILTFETWNWTRGAVVRIVAARLLLLVPANILTGVLGYFAGRAVGVDTMDFTAAMSVASTSNVGLVAYVLMASFVAFALYSALEAALSTYLYRALKPAPAPAAA
jgi:hypothetical protein